MDERDDDLYLRSPTLATWTVPEPGIDLADRIADTWHGERLSTLVVPPRRRSRALGGVALGACVGAAAAVLVMLMLRPGSEARTEAIPPAPSVPEAPSVVGPAMPARDPGVAKLRAELDEMRREMDRDHGERAEFILDLDVEPDGARVEVQMDGRIVAEVEGDARLLLPRAPFVAEISARGYRSSTVEGSPTVGPETAFEVRLQRDSEPRTRRGLMGVFRRAEPRAKSSDLKNPFDRDDDPAKSAKLRIGTTSGAAPARVYVDGTYLGTTPIVAHPVTPGRHTVEWHWDDGKVVRETVNVEGDDVRVLKRG